MRARRAALDALEAVRARDAYANLVLPAVLARHGLTGADAARATDLTYGTLRALGTLDRVIAACSSRPVRRIDAATLDVLRLGSFQLLAGRAAVHAAVSTSVDLAKERSSRGSAGFVNAVLRGVSTHDLAGWTAQLTEAGTVDAVAFRHYHPAWVVEALSAALADPASVGSSSSQQRVIDVLEADNAPPRVTLAALPGRCTVEELTASGAVPGRWAPTAAVLASGRPGAVPAVAAGRARVQDEGSQVVALALASADLPARPAPLPWLDMCAGPGGKAALLAAVAQGRGRRLVAAEKHPHRARLVARTLDAAGLAETTATVVADARRGPWPQQAFGRILLDAPCTGLGALRRRPESRWRRRPDDVARLVPLQRDLLAAGLDSLAEGGVLAYVTCSPHPAETVEVVEAVLADRNDVVIDDAPSMVPAVPDARRGPYLQLWPDVHGTDAMFAALLRRVGRAS